MPNTKSAERRVRSNAAKHLRNQSVKSRLKTLEKKYLDLLNDGDKEGATQALSSAASALDKAAKGGVIPKATADRKKSRLAVRLAAAGR
jgi:small subunit ribosomal protein S20